MPTLLSGIFFNFKYEKYLDSNKTYIYCANHVSNLDIMYLSMIGKGRFHFMGKQELLTHPILSIFFKSIDVPVDRSSRMSSFRAFMRAGENLKTGMDLIIFPEGRIDDVYPPKLQEFKSGPIRLALQLQIPIVPISSVNLWKIMWDDGFKFGSRPGIADIYVHAPIEPVVFEGWDEDQLKAFVYEKIKSKINS